MTMIVVTHNEDLAMRMPRRLQMHEGVIIDTTQEPSHPASTPAQCAE